MSSDGEDLSEDNSSESNMAYEEWVGGRRVGTAIQAGVRPDLVCMDSGCNRIVLGIGTSITPRKFSAVALRESKANNNNAQGSRSAAHLKLSTGSTTRNKQLTKISFCPG